MITLDQARTLLLDEIAPLGVEPVAIGEAHGRVLAEAIVASHDQPSGSRSMMDGIAVVADMPPVGTTFRLVGEASAGLLFANHLARDEAIRIATGAVVPAGAARVIPQEQLRFEHDQAVLADAVGSATFIRTAGSDFARGETLLDAGERLDAATLGLAAAANRAALSVRRRPRVAVLASGDELVAPGSALGDGQTVDSASYIISALIEEWGGLAERRPILADDEAASVAALGDCVRRFDLVVAIGGASVGARDFLRPAARAIGAELRFEKIAMQPGKPCWHARALGGGLILGLPGNPSSAFVCAQLLLRPLVGALLGAVGSPRRFRARTRGALSAGNRELYIRGSVGEEEGVLVVDVVPSQDSGLQSVLARSNCLVRLAPEAQVAAGKLVEVILTRPW